MFNCRVILREKVLWSNECGEDWPWYGSWILIRWSAFKFWGDVWCICRWNLILKRKQKQTKIGCLSGVCDSGWEPLVYFYQNSTNNVSSTFCFLLDAVFTDPILVLFFLQYALDKPFTRKITGSNKGVKFFLAPHTSPSVSVGCLSPFFLGFKNLRDDVCQIRSAFHDLVFCAKEYRETTQLVLYFSLV